MDAAPVGDPASMAMKKSDPLAPAKKRPHAQLKREVLRAVNRLPGVFVFPCSVGSFRVGARYVRMGMKGTPDLVGWRTSGLDGFGTWCSACTFVALEVKVGTDRLRPEQRAFLEKVQTAGGIAAEIRSVQDAIAALQ